MRLVETTARIAARPVTLAPDGTSYLQTWADVERDAGDGPQIATLPVLLMRYPDGAVQLADVGAAAAFDAITPHDLPEGVHGTLAPAPPPTSRDGMTITADTVRRLVTGERPDLAGLHAALATHASRFVAFPHVGDAPPAALAALIAAYIVSTFLLAAFPAVGYLWVTGLRNSGKSTVAHVIARTACLPLITSGSSTIASLRGHADAGGTAILDNWEGVNGKDDHARAMRDFVELGYQQGGTVTLQVPKANGRGYETARCSVFANRVFTAVAEPLDAIGSRCIPITMVRTADTTKASLDPWDADNWDTPPDALVQAGWMVAAHHLADAARTVKTITTANTGLTNRDLQKWRPALTVACMVDAENGNTAAWDALIGLAHALIRQGAEDDGSREAIVARTLAALFNERRESVSASLVMERANHLADSEERDVFGLDTAKKVGRLLGRMGVAKATRTGSGRGYILDAATVARLTATYLPATRDVPRVVSVPTLQHVTHDTNVTNDTAAAGSDVRVVSAMCDVSSPGVANDTGNVTPADRTMLTNWARMVATGEADTITKGIRIVATQSGIPPHPDEAPAAFARRLSDWLPSPVGGTT